MALGKETSLKVIVPLLRILVKDEMKDVRQNVVEDCQVLTDAIGLEEAAEVLLPFIMDLSRDGKWRVRSGVIERMGLFGSKSSLSDFPLPLDVSVRDRACLWWAGLSGWD